MKNKVRVGIEINEIIRALWIQFDKYYAQEFGEDDIPENPYSFDLFNTYKFKDTKESFKELKEPEDMPNDINPLYYQTDDNNEALADPFLFKKEETIELTAKQVYNRFMYEDYLFEIFGSAPLMYYGLDVHLNKFIEKYQDNVEFVFLSIENKFSIPPTLFFLSKINSRSKKYEFVDNYKDLWKNVDVLITTNPDVLKNKKPFFKHLIKLDRPYNINIKTKGINVLQVNDLYENKEFEKIIRYKNK